jgi:hypothetical protein
MAAKNTQKVRMCLTPAATTTTTIVPTAITAVAAGTSKPAGVKVAAPTIPLVGEIVTFPQDIGFASLAGKSFAVTSVTATDFEIGNLTLGTGALAATPSGITHYTDTEMECVCLSEFSMSTAAPAVIDTSTYCGSSSIPSAKTEAGTATAAGYVDVADKGFQAVLAAVEDGKQRILRVSLGDNGYLIMPVTLSGLSYTLPLDGAQSYGFQFTFAAAPKLVHA